MGLCLLSLLIVSCSPLKSPEVSDGSVLSSQYVPVTQAGKKYQTLMLLTKNYAGKALQTMSLYGGVQVSNRLAKAVGSDGVVDISDLSDLAGADLLCSNRVKPGSKDGESAETVTLSEELAELASNYQKEVEALAPDMSLLAEQEGMTTNEQGLQIGDDMIVDPNTLSGAITIELMNAQLRGEDLDAVAADMGLSADSIAGADCEKGVYKYATSKWSDNKVYYCFESMTENYRTAVREAMADWSAKVPGLKFEDKTSDEWHKFWASICLASLVMMNEVSGMSANGQSTLGRGAGKTILNLRQGLHTDPSYFYRTPRHELGHTLGLSHEHQRWDRDDYVSIPSTYLSDTVNFGKIDKTMTISINGVITTWKYYTLTVWGVSIRIWYPVFSWGKIDVATLITAGGPATFDYQSIMLYSYAQNGLRAKKSQQGLNAGDPIPLNTNISPMDAATVKMMYGL